MARPVDTKGGGKKRKPLNASLPTQLVLDFNAVASKQGNGKRDALLEEVLLSFLANAVPQSKSVQQIGGADRVFSPRRASFSARAGSRLIERMKEREAIRIARECAEKILEVTAKQGRKGPKASSRMTTNRKRKAS